MSKSYKLKMPTTFTLLFILTVIAAILTWVLPTGEYAYRSVKDPSVIIQPQQAAKIHPGKQYMPVPGTYQHEPRNPASIGDVLEAPINGLAQAIDIALFVLVIGGFLRITMSTGAIDAGIGRVIERLREKKRELWIIPVIMLLVGIGGTTYGMAEETIAFYPVLVPVFVAIGLDPLVSVAVLLLGSGIGDLASTTNPFATAIASGFANTSIGNGLFLRLFLFIVLIAIGIIYTMWYARRVRKDYSHSLVANLREEHRKAFMSADAEEHKLPAFTGKRKLVLVLFTFAFLLMIYGVIPWDSLGLTALPTLNWWFTEITAVFLTFAVIIGFIYGLKEEKIINDLVQGARDLLSVALLIGVARGINVVMQDGLITATILHWGENIVAHMSQVMFVNAIFWIEFIISFIVPSSSGLATLTMPIFAPIGSFIHVPPDMIVTAYQSGIGLLGIVVPTSGVVVGGLQIAKVPYVTWLRFTWPILLIFFIVITIFLSVGTFM